MSHSEHTYGEETPNNSAGMKLEKFKKTAFEIIENKDKIIKLLYTILEVQGLTTLNVKELISRNTNISKDQLWEHTYYGTKTNKKKASSRKRAILDMQNNRSKKKKKELNIFSTPSKINDHVNSDRELLNFSKLKSQNEQKLQQQQQELQQELQQQLKDAMNGHMISAREHNSSLKKSLIESRKRATENIKMKNANGDKNYKSDSHVALCSSKKKTKLSESIDDDCQLCLMPNSESLHGSFPPLLFKLSCGHVFHLMCLYEIIIRRECRKTCCACHSELKDEDRNTILNKVKLEKKENDKKNKMLLKVMQMQASRD